MSAASGSFLEQFDRGVGDELPPPRRESRGDLSRRGMEEGFVAPEPFALHGAVITASRALSSGYVVVDGDRVAAVGEKRPDVADVRETDGVILPGLIDMHNHPNFNIFAAWEPPRLYNNRGAWRRSREYDLLIKQPQEKLTQLQRQGALPQGVQLRYAEIRALVTGVTAIQGANDPRREPGPEPLVRNIDRWIFGQHRARSFVDLPARRDEVEDFTRYQADPNVNALYLHLCEGRRGDASSAREFEKFLSLGGATDKTVIIHGTSLTPEQIQHVAQAGCKLVWSPQSNLRLYGETTLASEALRNSMPVALGADWLPSGSTSLLAEMKVARRMLEAQGAPVKPDALVRMVTSDAAHIAGLGDKLGALEEGCPADILVLERHYDDPYDNVVEADPSWVELVMIGGDVCFARADWLPGPPEGAEVVLAWGKKMVLDTRFDAARGVPSPSLSDARALLTANYPPVGPIFA